MANTELLAAINLVHTAKKEVSSARFDTNLDAAFRAQLEPVYVQLDDLEDTLISADISSHIDAIKADAAKLADEAAKIKNSIAELQAIAADVEKAAQAAGVLADLLSRASAAGLIY